MHKSISLTIIILFISSLCCNVSFAEEVLTWQDCVKEAARNHPDLIAAIQNVKQQQAGKVITASGLYPQISSSVDASTATKGTTATAKTTTTNSFTYGASADQLIFDGFKTINNVKAASENINAAQQGYRFTSSEVRLNLRTAFINLLK